MSTYGKPLVWLHGEIKTPPLSDLARLEAGNLLCRLQRAEKNGTPHSRPMPGIGTRCHELRIIDETVTWRNMYRIDPDAVVLLAVFRKKSKSTSKHVIAVRKKRLKWYDDEIRQTTKTQK